MSRWDRDDLAKALEGNSQIRISPLNAFQQPKSPIRTTISPAPETPAEPRKRLNAPNHKKRKYRNQPVLVDGLRFDSKREAKRYQELRLMQRAGAIQNLTLQPRYELIVEGIKICTYVADFAYQTKQGHQMVVEDCKGVRTRVYLIKKNLMRAVYGIEVLET